ncbi:MAG: polyphenol oxidase family protein [Ilumatobacter sp.]|nr:polyphenol oxidase family protein [Ilumatobacter sp.]
MHVLLDRVDGDRRFVAVASERSDGDVHPHKVAPDVLDVRQRAVAGAPWVMADQVHGTGVVQTGDEPLAWPLAGRGDVVVTTRPGIRLAVWAADCAPLALFGVAGTVVLAHGGWRGLAAGVIDAAVGTATGGGDSISAAVLGPVIHPCCYAFGPAQLGQVAAGVGSAADDIGGTTHGGDVALDVPAAVAAGLRRHGIDLDVVGPCTGCSDRWYSHRMRDDRGRHALIAWTDRRPGPRSATDPGAHVAR